MLAQRTLDGASADGREPRTDRERLVEMFQRCTSRKPDEGEVKDLTEALAAFRKRFEASPADAAKILAVGATPAAAKIPAPELAAWTLIANAIFSLDLTICKS